MPTHSRALPWAVGPVAVLDLIEDMTVKIQGRLDVVVGPPWELAAHSKQAKSSFDWLPREDAERWYLSHTLAPQGSFCMLLRHIVSECGRISREDGFFITLNYAVSVPLALSLSVTLSKLTLFGLCLACSCSGRLNWSHCGR